MDKDFLVHHLKIVYRKVVCDDPEIGWLEAEDELYFVLVELMGVDEFAEWTDSLEDA
jgi:hypothetical protein